MAPHTRGVAGAAGRVTATVRLGPALLAMALASALAAGCGDDGRTMAEPDESQTTTTAAAAGAPATTAVMRLTSPDFAEGGAMPAANTCFGDDLSPALTLADVPTDTAMVAFVVRDVDADGFVHWVITNVPAQGGGVSEGTVPDGAVEALNGFGTVGWRGPCPPSGTHHYDIRAYALKTPIGVTEGMPGAEAASLIESADQASIAALSVTATADPG